jgi:tRNA-splicing ligase RtcB
MKIVQDYAFINRTAIANVILNEYGLERQVDEHSTIHNYIDLDKMILRKGAVSAAKGETVVIPMNMRDGVLLCRGKGNPDWNYSAPHGAGRLMSRSKAKEAVTLEEFKESMEGIYTTSVDQSTLDESPMAYKPMQEIIDNIGDTVDVLKVLRPVYNFKASE